MGGSTEQISFLNPDRLRIRPADPVQSSRRRSTMGLEDQAENRPPVRDWGSSVFVWGVWCAMAGILCNFVRHFGLNMPMWDDWHIMPWIVGTRSLSWDWL